MKRQLQAVEIFHKSFNQPAATSPTLISKDLSKLRFELGKEELEEYQDACQDGDLRGICDSLTDQLYVLCGTILTHGMQHIIEDCFDEVQRSNLSKLDVDGKPIINGRNGVLDPNRPQGKILKSENFFEPNLSQFL